MATINYEEVNVNELKDVTETDDGEIINEEVSEETVKKPSKFKSALKVTLCVTKKIVPYAAVYSLGYFTKAIIGKVAGVKVTSTDIPEIPMKTEVIDIGDEVISDVVSDVVSDVADII